jgi:epoxyqueuosine reductase
MTTHPIQLGREVVRMCTDLGFAAAGIADVSPSRFGAQFHQWIDEGKHGEMDYLAAEIDSRLDPATLLAGARSIVMVADQYEQRGQTSLQPADEPRGRIARYAHGRDYHRVIRDRLHALTDGLRERFREAGFRAFVDTAPALERELAARAGIGWVAKNTLVIHPQLGSYLLLGGIVTTLDIAAPPEQETTEDHCGTCTRCIDACPTGAITPFSVDASRCVSYLTIERRTPIEPRWFDGIGDWVYGCDICQDVCPHNSARKEEVGQVRDDYREGAIERSSIPLVSILGWDEDEKRRVFRRSAMWRATLEMMKRNALIAAGNAVRKGHAEVLRAIRDRAWDTKESELVRQTARDVLDWLGEHA